MFGPTITSLLPLMVFVIFWLAEGVVNFTSYRSPAAAT
jgi:hypothetical protein